MEITDVLIKSKSGEYDLEMVRRLTISSMKLARSRNQIVEIEGLDNLPLLERLDLSWNEIRRARNLAHLRRSRSSTCAATASPTSTTRSTASAAARRCATSTSRAPSRAARTRARTT